MTTRHILSHMAATLALVIGLFPQWALAGPEGGRVVGGSGTIAQPSVTETVVTQQSRALALEWDRFNLGADERIRFDQPGANAAVLNRILDVDPSVILGQIDANGRVFLANPNGVIFGEGARVNVGALVASGLDMDPTDFLADRYRLEGGGGPVINRGLIAAARGGSVSLVGGEVANHGVIAAELGQIHLGAGRTGVIDFDGDGLIGFAVTEGDFASATNTGTLAARTVLMSAHAAGDVLSGAVNHSGVIRATGLVREGGTVTLVGDTVQLSSGAVIDASGRTGGGTVLVGGDLHGTSPAAATPAATTTTIDAGATIHADAIESGNGGKVVVWADDTTRYRGHISATGGARGGNGGMVEVSGKQNLAFAGGVDTSAPAGETGTLLLDPATLTIIDAAATGGDQDANLSAATPVPATIAAADADTALNTVSWGTIDALAATSNVVLEATGLITVADVTGVAGGTTTANNLVMLDLTGAGDLTIRSTAGGVAFADVNDVIRTEGGAVTIEGLGGDVTAGSINTTGAAGNQTGGTVTVTAAGNLSVQHITTGAAAVNLTADADSNSINTLTLNGTLSGGAVTLSGGTDLNDTLATAGGTNGWIVTGGGSGSLNGDSFNNFGSLTGGAGVDTLSGQPFNTSWNITGANSGSMSWTGTPSGAYGFAGMENLTGGNGNDTFVFGPAGSISGLVTGGAQATGDSADYSAVTANTTVTVGTDITGVENITGRLGHTLGWSGGDSSWRIDGTNSGRVVNNNVTFTNFNHLVGGGTVDLFTFSGGGTLTADSGVAGTTGTIDGGLGNDQVDYSPSANPVTVTLGTDLTRVELVTGHGTNDTLVGAATGNTWSITSLNGGTVSDGANTVTFTGFANLTGGSGADQFSLSGGTVGQSIDGGLGTDTLAGDNLANSWTVTGAGAGTVTGVGTGFSNIENLTGGTLADSFVLSGGTLAGSVAGGAGNDSLTANNLANSWTVTGTGTGTVTGVGGGFTGMEQLTGGTLADGFVYGATGAISGLVDGGAGSDTIDFGAVTAPLTVTVGTTVANMESIIGGTGDTLVIPVGTNNWNITGANAGTVGTIGFAGFDTLIGGTGTDRFALSGGSFTGTLNGGAGSDELAGDNTTNTWRLSAADSGLLNSATLFTGIEALTGGTGSDTLRGTDQPNAWSLTGSGSGNLNTVTTFSGMEHLAGGNADDAFVFGANGAIVTLQGNLQTSGDSADYSAVVAPVALTIGTDINGIESVTGSGDTLSAFVNAPAGTNNWSLTGTDAGNVVTGQGTVIFSGFANLNGNNNPDLFNIGPSGGLTGTFAAGAGADQINGPSAGATWNITGADAGSLTNVAGFSGVERINAGNGADTFIVGPNGSISGLIQGGGGTDSVDYSAVTTPVNPVLGTDLQSVESVIGDGVNDTLTAAGTTNNWTITGTGSGTVGTVAFTGFANLTGGGAVDRFTLSGGTVPGQINGGGGVDTLTADNVTNSWAITGPASGGVTGVGGYLAIENLTGGSGADTFTLSGGSVPGTLNGGGGTDILVADNVANSWNITGAGSGSVTGVTAFTGMERLTGGTADDAYLFGAAGSVAIIDGGGQAVADSADFSAVTSPVAVTLGGNVIGVESITGDGTDSLAGPDQTNSWNITGLNQGTVAGVAFSGFANLTGGSAADGFTLAGGTVAGTIDGGAGTDTLTAGNQANSWTVTTTGGGLLTGTGGFAGMENLTGGSADDTFIFGANGAVSGVVSGGGQAVADRVDYSAVANPVTVTLQGTVVGVESITGDGINDTLIAENTNNAWSVTGTGTGTVGAVAFTNFANLTGGGADDVFVFGAAGAVGGIVNGGGQTVEDRIDYSAVATPVAVNLGTTTLGFERLAGNGVNHTLTGTDAGQDWVLSAANSGTVDGTPFTGFVGLSGGTGNDRFVLSGGTLAGTVNGGAGTDSLTADNLINSWTITGAGSGTLTGTGGFTGMEQLTGGSAADLFTLNGGTLSGLLDGGAGADHLIADNTVNSWAITGAGSGTLTGTGGFAGMEQLTGGNLADAFVYGAGGSISGLVDGGAGADSIDYSAVTAPVAMRVGTTIANLESVTGDGVNDSLFVGNGTNNWVLTANQTGDVTTPVGSIAFSGMTGLEGGTGTDTLTGANLPNNWVINTANGGTLSGTGTFSAMDSLVGGNNADTFTLAGGTLSGLVDGGSGTDTLQAANTTNNWAITGTGSGTVTGTGGFAGMENLSGGSLTDLFTIDAGAGSSITGTLFGGAGNDRLEVNYTAAGSRNLTFVGDAGTDTVVLTGGGAGFSGEFSPGVTAADTVIRHTDGARTQRLTATNVSLIEDRMTARSVTVNGTIAADAATLGTGTIGGTHPVRIGLGGQTIQLSGKNDLTLNLGGGVDTLDITGPITLPGTLTLAAEDILAQSGAVVTAQQLAFSGSRDVGTVSNPLDVTVGSLQIASGTGSAHIRASGGLILTASDLLGDLNLTTGGNLIATSNLSIGGNLSVSLPTAADLILTGGGNQLGGTLSVSSGGPLGNVSLVDNSALALPQMNIAGNLNVTAQGALTQSGALAVGGTTTVDAGANAIQLNHPSNALSGLSVHNTGAANVLVNSTTAVALGSSSVGIGSFTLTAPAVSQTGAITQGPGAASFSVNANGGAVALTDAGNDITGRLTVTSGSAAITTTAGLRVGGVNTDGDVTLTAGGPMTLGTVSAGSGVVNLNAGGGVPTDLNAIHVAGSGLNVVTPNQPVGTFLVPLTLNVSGPVRFDAGLVNFRGVTGQVSGAPGTQLVNTDGLITAAGLGKQVIPRSVPTIDLVRPATDRRLFALEGGGVRLPPERQP